MRYGHESRKFMKKKITKKELQLLNTQLNQNDSSIPLKLTRQKFPKHQGRRHNSLDKFYKNGNERYLFSQLKSAGI